MSDDYNHIATAIINGGERLPKRPRETELLETIAADDSLTARNIRASIAGEPTNTSKIRREHPASQWIPHGYGLEGLYGHRQE